MNKEDIIKWAKKLRTAHKNPLVRLELPGTKFYVPSGSEIETESVNNSLDSLTKVFYCERVERRCARSIGNWLPEQRLTEVTKITAALKNFGFANKTGKFLYPEETLYLLETNRLELFWNNIPVSIQQAYEVILNDSDVNLAKYMTYKELTLQNFRVLRSDHVLKQETIGEPSTKKIRLSEHQDNSETKVQSNEMLKSIFTKLQENGPKKFNPVIETKSASNYQLFKADNCSKILPDFNLNMFQGESFGTNLNNLEEKIPTVLAYTEKEFVKYFRIRHVDLPNLI